MLLATPTCLLRPWHDDDVISLVRHADNPSVAGNLRDRFPHPYTEEDARQWISFAQGQHPPANFAVVVKGEAVGGIGVVPGGDIDRVSGEVGYWLGETHWGKGITTEALRAFAPYCFATFSLTRLFATPFAHNVASRRVLEKAGFRLEGVLGRAAIKHGQIIDLALYGLILLEEKRPT